MTLLSVNHSSADAFFFLATSNFAGVLLAAVATSAVFKTPPRISTTPALASPSHIGIVYPWHHPILTRITHNRTMAEVLRNLIIKDVFAGQEVVTIRPDDTINHAFQVRYSRNKNWRRVEVATAWL
jgi:hypothetical protein